MTNKNYKFRIIGTPVTIGQLKNAISKYNDDVPFGFRNQKLQSLAEESHDGVIYVSFDEGKPDRTNKSFEEMIFEKAFPSKEYNADDFYDWASENSKQALDFAFEIANKIIRI
jgi:hypothetical protein